MKFVYEYRTSDNAKHSGEISASSRDVAFAALKAKGIRPSSVVEAPGLFNKLFGKGKRWLAIVVLAVLAAFSVRYALTAKEAVSSITDSTDRRQLIGDSAIIEKGIRSGWAEVFSCEGDRFLASFAIPGVPAGQRTTSIEELEAAVDREIAVEPGDSMEARQIKSIVAGMKEELRAFLKAGGSVRQYAALLVKRQDEEIGYYNRAKTEIESARKANADEEALISLWEERNDSLRQMGIKLVPMPE